MTEDLCQSISSTYIDFSRRYQEDAHIRQAISPAEEFVKRIDSAKVNQVLMHLQSLILQIEKLTGLPSAIHLAETSRPRRKYSHHYRV